MSKDGVRMAALLLADGRFPAGGHAHSAGIEAAVLDGRVGSNEDLVEFLRGRLHTAGLTEAALAVATVHAGITGGLNSIVVLDGEAEARITVPALRASSRRLGRQLLRAVAACWPCPLLEEVAAAFPAGPHHAVAFGIAGIASGLCPAEVARLALYQAIATPAAAAVRLLGLNPFSVVALLAELEAEAAEVLEGALLAATAEPRELPAHSGPAWEIAAAWHALREERLFAT